VDAKRIELGWEWNEKHLGGDMNAELSQSFFGGLILRGFLSAPSPAADTVTIYNGFDDPNRRRRGSLSNTITVYPFNRLRFLM